MGSGVCVSVGTGSMAKNPGQVVSYVVTRRGARWQSAVVCGVVPVMRHSGTNRCINKVCALAWGQEPAGECMNKGRICCKRKSAPTRQLRMRQWRCGKCGAVLLVARGSRGLGISGVTVNGAAYASSWNSRWGVSRQVVFNRTHNNWSL